MERELSDNERIIGSVVRAWQCESIGMITNPAVALRQGFDDRVGQLDLVAAGVARWHHAVRRHPHGCRRGTAGIQRPGGAAAPVERTYAHRVLSWLALLARSDRTKDVQIWCSDTRSPYIDDATDAPR